MNDTDRPLTRRLMDLIQRTITDSEGAILKMDVAKEIGVAPSKLSQWMGGKRAAPEGEKTLRLIEWGNKNSKNFLENLFGVTHSK